VRIGGLWLGDLEPGAWAILNSKEIAMLLGEAPVNKKARSAPKTRKKRPL